MLLIACGFLIKYCNLCPFRELQHRIRNWSCFLLGYLCEPTCLGSGANPWMVKRNFCGWTSSLHLSKGRCSVIAAPSPHRSLAC
ncbi:hypothetical protein CMV_027133, partial [Castanea mollissima]